ncbi:MAG: glycosyltransferase family 2 protein [Candidatus Zixiibacteriota bacterium]|nr:MAG: glycosyltransferase family 2 protein [candidate division Zixibacteria bacterium]
MNRISVVIITKNEEENLSRCLDSVRWADEIIVVDSKSTDRTLEIAEQYGAKIFRPEWRGFGPAKQEGVRRAGGDWILSIDADEVVAPELAQEIKAVTLTDDGIIGYYMPRRTQFLGRWINHCGWYPGWVLRLFRKDSGDFDDALVHEKVIVKGNTARLKHDLLHYSFPTIDVYLEKQWEYAELGAQQAFRGGRRSGALAVVVRPLASFVKHYVLKRGFLDGIEGFLISALAAYYVMVKYAKLRNLAQQSKPMALEETNTDADN